VSYAGLPGSQKDWIAIAPAGSDNTNYLAFVFTNGQTSGTATFTAPAAGSYVARAFSNNTFTLLVESAAFTVAAPSVSTDATTYVAGGTITVTYGGLPGNQKDWIAIAPMGSANTSYLDFAFTNGQAAGTATFTVSTPGLYVARAFVNNTFTLAAESAVFMVCDAAQADCFVATLTGANSVPANGSTATGTGLFVFDVGTSTLTYYVKHTIANVTAAHIHEGAAGTNGPVIIPFTLTGQTASGSAVLTAGQTTELFAGSLYTNVHSPAFPAGEIRGQLLHP